MLLLIIYVLGIFITNFILYEKDDRTFKFEECPSNMFVFVISLVWPSALAAITFCGFVFFLAWFFQLPARLIKGDS